MKRLVLLISFALALIATTVLTAPGLSQNQADTQKPSFEVASVKPSDPVGLDAPGDMQFLPGGRLRVTRVPLRVLIAWAYSLALYQSEQQMTGVPDWIRSQRYDIEAKAETDAPGEQAELMLQSLLADRFKLAVHWETRELPVYALVLAKLGRSGPHLVPHAADNSTCLGKGASQRSSGFRLPYCGVLTFFPGLTSGPGWAAAEVTMEGFAKRLSYFQQIDRAVIDRTGLPGVFDISLAYAPYVPAGAIPNSDPGPEDPSLPSSIFTALQEQLGLKLEPSKGPVDMLVIDHVERPTEN